MTTIEGIVKGPDGKPIAGCRGPLHAHGHQRQLTTTKTDKKGHYLHMGLPMGMYDIEMVMYGKSG